ncbi:MAG: hypothetical protein NC927_00945 [Candidatus Omnitrophica bacterium]|nr:hypothetical protein [Candidatus Omnitrophota bacterium]
MAERNSILILGEGRIARAVFYYLKNLSSIKRADFFSSISRREIKDFSLIVSCLPGKEAPLGLELALRYRKNLLDISDLDPPFYIRKIEEIEKAKILVIPGCGFCPGLVNFVIGREILFNQKIDGVFIKAGSLSRKKLFFPFLWCLEDLAQEHRLSSWQIISGKKRKLSPFAGYKKEKILGIEAETYFSVSGFENLFKEKRFINFHFRVIRPQGFMVFFNFLENYNFFHKMHFEYTRQILEGVKSDNYTLAFIDFLKGDRKIISWIMRSFSKKEEKINSMQKITAIVPVALLKVLFLNKFSPCGLLFMERLGENQQIFKQILEEIEKIGIILKRKEA